MNKQEIKTYIEKIGLRRADALHVGALRIGLRDPNLIYLGTDKYDESWFVGRFDSGVRMLSQDQLVYLIQEMPKWHLNPFLGDEKLRLEAITRMFERMDLPTFNLICRRCNDYRKALKESKVNLGDETAKNIAKGVGIGVGIATILGAIGAVLLSSQKDDEPPVR